MVTTEAEALGLSTGPELEFKYLRLSEAESQ
jgi:hypothetical protein